MSSRAFTENGYGYKLFNGKNIDRIISFILKNSPGTYDEDEEQDIRNCLDEWDLEDILGEPVAYLLADIINGAEKTGCVRGYVSDGDTGQFAMLGIEPLYSWNVSENDPKTKEDAEALLRKYGEILGITENPDFFEAEYFG